MTSDNELGPSAATGDNSEVKKSEPEMGLKKKIIHEMKSIGLIIFAVFLFRSVFYEPFKIPTGSMIPTLMIGDFILVNKMAYGFKVPFSDWFTDPVYISTPTYPHRGDVVVFKFPNDTSVNYIKRVIGLPGDTIEIRDKVVYINNVAVDKKEVDGRKYMEDMDEKFSTSKLKFYQGTINKENFIYQVDEENFYKTDFEKITVPKDHFFVMGDNRDFSYDSRFWGFVPFKYIKGRAVLVWFSMIFPFGEYKSKFRYWRIGTPIH